MIRFILGVLPTRLVHPPLNASSKCHPTFVSSAELEWLQNDCDGGSEWKTMSGEGSLYECIDL
jgi:hypothetical protein